MYFSIVIPVYNVEKYLTECLNSVAKQTFTDYELILVDDGSKDNSGMICDSFKENHANTTVIHQENQGQASARNVGTLVACGEYITYLDSDDYYITDDFLQSVYDHLQKEHSDLVLYKYQEFKDGETKLKPCDFSLEEAATIKNTDTLLMHLVTKDAFYASAWSKVIKRKLMIESSILFQKGITGEDNEWYLHLLSTCNCSITVIDRPFVAYRQREGSISKIFGIKTLADSIYVLQKWNSGIANAQISEQRKNALYGAMAKFYANLLITYVRTTDPERVTYKESIKQLNKLLHYSQSRRPMIMHKVSSIVGFDGALLLLKVLDRIKR